MSRVADCLEGERENRAAPEGRLESGEAAARAATPRARKAIHHRESRQEEDNAGNKPKQYRMRVRPLLAGPGSLRAVW